MKNKKTKNIDKTYKQGIFGTTVISGTFGGLIGFKFEGSHIFFGGMIGLIPLLIYLFVGGNQNTQKRSQGANYFLIGLIYFLISLLFVFLAFSLILFFISMELADTGPGHLIGISGIGLLFYIIYIFLRKFLQMKNKKTKNYKTYKGVIFGTTLISGIIGHLFLEVFKNRDFNNVSYKGYPITFGMIGLIPLFVGSNQNTEKRNQSVKYFLFGLGFVFVVIFISFLVMFFIRFVVEKRPFPHL